MIIPVFNVQDYLDECLDSIATQSLKDIEIIAIDDGSTDTSFDLLKQYAEKEPRLRIFTQENSGLGATRNRGLSLARGRFITFVDSDDTIPHNAYSIMAKTLEKTGSDFVIGQIYRTKGEQEIWPKWSRNLHDTERLKIGIDDFPEILRDFYSPNKLYKKSFWDQNNFKFREGVIFEDQPLITQIFTKAKSFDVITTPTYCWKIREDGTSLSSNLFTEKMLKARIEASKLTVQYLIQESTPSNLEAWQTVFLKWHMMNYLKATLRQDRRTAEYIMELIRVVLAGRDVGSLASVPAQLQLFAELAASNELSAIQQLLLDGLDKPSQVPMVFHAEETVYKPSARLDSGEVVRDVVFTEERAEVNAGIYEYHRSREKLKISGWAFLNEIELNTEDSEIFLVFRHASDGESITVPVHWKPNEKINSIIKSPYCNRINTGWTVELSLDIFGAQLVHRVGMWQLGVNLMVRGRTYATFDVRPALRGVPPKDRYVPINRFTALALAVKSDWFTGIEVVKRALVVVDAVQDRNETSVVLALKNSIVPQRLVLKDRERELDLNFQATPADGFTEVRVKIPHTSSSKIYLESEKGRRYDPFVSSDIANREDGSILSYAGRGGITFPDQFLFHHVTTFKKTTDAINVYLQNKNADFFVFDRSSGEKVAALDSINVNCLSVPMALLRDLPLGRYIVASRYDQDSQFVTVRIANDLQLPEEFLLADRVVSVGYSSQGIQFEIRASSFSSLQSPFALRQAIDGARDRQLDESAIYFQCLKGSDASDSQLSIRNSLLNIDPTLRFIWGVDSDQRFVPQGDSIVIVGTEAWAETLTTSKMVCVNHELPQWFIRKVGQLVVQTYHGHPFKTMGLARWSAQGVCDVEKQRNLNLRRNWTHLVSPSPFATDLYKKQFPLEYEVIETGYPRNDDLIVNAESMRSVTRKELGISESSHVILYMPTWRDYDAISPWRSNVPSFLTGSRFHGNCLLMRFSFLEDILPRLPLPVSFSGRTGF